MPIGCATTKNGYFQLIFSCDSLNSNFCVMQYITEVISILSRRLFVEIRFIKIILYQVKITSHVNTVCQSMMNLHRQGHFSSIPF